MGSRALRSLFAASVMAALIEGGACGPADAVGGGTVSTLAGSGLPGIADGAATRASFLMPAAVAYDAAGNLIVVDAAAQRVRRVRPDGQVETVAGSGVLSPGATSVAGGFADGSHAAARFNWPRGVAVAKNGTIYVADTGNHCIRAILPSGTVSVYAGSPQRSGGALGTRTTASFSSPTGLAFDAKGALYVADPQAGLRKIDADGTVTAVAFGHAPTGVAIAADAAGAQTLYVVDADGILMVAPSGPPWRLASINRTAAPASASDPPGTVVREMAMQAPVGNAQTISALPDGHLFYADPRSDTIRYAFPTYAFAETLAGVARDDASGEGAGFGDGPLRDARFNVPLATAVSADGKTVAVADAGNRRIRLLHLDVAHDVAQLSSLLPTADAPDDAYRIVYVGPSTTWYDSTGADSVSTRIEEQLRADGALAARKLTPTVRFFDGVANPDPLESVARAIAEAGLDKIVIFDVTQNTVDPNLQTALANSAAWQANLTAHLRGANAILTAAGITLVVDIHPLPIEYSANEYATSRMGLPGLGSGRIPELRIEPLLRAAVLASGVPLIDTYPAFRADAMHPTGADMGMVDSHASVHGRIVLGRAIARGIEQLAPWTKAP